MCLWKYDFVKQYKNTSPINDDLSTKIKPSLIRLEEECEKHEDPKKPPTVQKLNSTIFMS